MFHYQLIVFSSEGSLDRSGNDSWHIPVPCDRLPELIDVINRTGSGSNTCIIRKRHNVKRSLRAWNMRVATHAQTRSYLREHDIERIHILRCWVGDWLTEAEETSAEEPVGQVNLHDHVHEIHDFAKSQAVCPRSIQVQAVQEADTDLLYLLVALILWRYLDILRYLNLRLV